MFVYAFISILLFVWLVFYVWPLREQGGPIHVLPVSIKLYFILFCVPCWRNIVLKQYSSNIQNNIQNNNQICIFDCLVGFCLYWIK